MFQWGCCLQSSRDLLGCSPSIRITCACHHTWLFMSGPHTWVPIMSPTLSPVYFFILKVLLFFPSTRVWEPRFLHCNLFLCQCIPIGASPCTHWPFLLWYNSISNKILGKCWHADKGKNQEENKVSNDGMKLLPPSTVLNSTTKRSDGKTLG